MRKTIWVDPKDLALCSIKADVAGEMDRYDVANLMSWCDAQPESFWEGLNLQEILNVYRVSAKYIYFEDWLEEDEKAAVKAWKRAVEPVNKNRLLY